MQLQDLPRQELQPFLQKNDLRGFQNLAVTWGLIAMSFALVARWPNPFTVLIALVILGNRQLALGVMMHDCAHQSLFQSPKLNAWIGQWLCAYPILSDLPGYWKVHAIHHRHTGSAQDPDLANYRAYPVSRASLKRKLIRDITRQTGIKILLGTFRSGQDLFNLSGQQTRPSLRNPLLVNAALLLTLTLLGHPWLYLLWVAAYVTTYMLFARVRQIAEHGAVPDLTHPDPRQHTRSTQVRFWERLLFAPHQVQYHLEHHLLPSVPPYRLAKLQRYLKKAGFYEGVHFPVGYAQVMRDVSFAAKP